jgi:small-conductance mechanosensitive channel
LKTLGVLFLFFFQLCWADDLENMNQSIDSLALRAETRDVRLIFQANSKLEEYLPVLKKCINDENLSIKQFSDELKALQKINNLELGLAEKKIRLKLLHLHQDKKIFCEFLSLKIHTLQKKFSEINNKIYENDLIKRQSNILESMAQPKQLLVKNVTFKFIFPYLKKSNAASSLIQMVLIFIMLAFLKSLSLTKNKQMQIFKKISLSQYFKVICILIVLSPFQIILLKTVYSHHDELLLYTFNRPIIKVMFLALVSYFYFFYKNFSLQKDVPLIFVHLIFLLLLIRSSFELNYFELNDFSSQEVLFKKNMILIFLQPVIYSVGYWTLIRILEVHKYFRFMPWLFLFIVNVIFLVGLIGYIDWAVNIDYMLIINLIFIVYIFVLSFLKSKALEVLNNPQTQEYQFLEKIFLERQKLACFNMKILIYLLYTVCLIYLSLAMIILSFWFMPQVDINSFMDFFYSVHQINNVNFTIKDVMQSMAVMCLLNLANYAISNYLAIKAFQEKVSQQKTTNLFNWLGYMVSLFIVLKFIGFNLQNFIIVFGGLSLGLGLGLKDLLSSFLSSVVLFINRPFKIGDYIEIGLTKGYVKKISLLETTVETSDNNVLILPNQYVASSVIQNFNYENKVFQKVHINYTINNLQIEDEEVIKTKILDILKKNPNLLETPHQPIHIMFSLLERATDIYRLEVIFCLKNHIELNQEMTKINRKLHEDLKSMKLDIHFESMQYPFK